MPANLVTFDNVSRFYGEVLGVNRVNLSIPPGITSLVGPNGSGKTTLMNLMTGSSGPRAAKSACWASRPIDPKSCCRIVGYCTQFDAFPKGLTGSSSSTPSCGCYGYSDAECDRAGHRRHRARQHERSRRAPVAGYSKGMRQRIKLAQAIAHDPRVLVLDEPLNGLDPMARAETIALFQEWAPKAATCIVSSHILHEVDRISDQVILLSQRLRGRRRPDPGRAQRSQDQPMQILVRCDKPDELAARLFQQGHVVEAKIDGDGHDCSCAPATPTASICC